MVVNLLYIGRILIICALIATFLGALMPLLETIKISAPLVFIVLLLEIIVGFINPIFAALFPIVPVIYILYKLKWGLGILKALILGIVCGCIALLFTYYFYAFEPGLVAGIIACLICFIIGKYARIIIASSFLVAPVAFLLSLILNNFGINFLQVSSYFIDLSSTCMIFSFLAATIKKYVKNKKDFAKI